MDAPIDVMSEAYVCLCKSIVKPTFFYLTSYYSSKVHYSRTYLNIYI